MSEYREMDLIKVNDNGIVKYFAVSEKTSDSMLVTEATLSYSNDPELRNIKMDYLGQVLVEVIE